MEAQKSWNNALEYQNQLIVSFPWYTPAIAEKAKTQMAVADWEQALETTERLDEQEVSGLSIDSMKIAALYLLSRGPNGGRGQNGGGTTISAEVGAAKKLEELFGAIRQKEPHNGTLLLECVCLFSRLSGRSKKVLSVTRNALSGFVSGL
jgi:hypothetical protein